MNTRSICRFKSSFHIILLLILSGCQYNEKSKVKDKVLVYCSEASPETFNPQLSTSGTTFDATSRQIYNRLISFVPGTTKIQPSLANSWSVSTDGKKYRFHLRKGVKFQQTKWFTPSRDFNADDVMFSFLRQKEVNHPYHSIGGGKYNYFQTMGLGLLIKQITKIDNFTVEFELTQADNTFLAILAMDFASILSEEYASSLLKTGKPENLDRLPVGTGPFTLLDYKSDAFIRYEAHKNYWQHSPAINQLVFAITPDASQRFARLVAGECDLLSNPLPIHLKISEDYPALNSRKTSGLNIAFWSFNSRIKPFDNPNVRKALAMAIDREQIIRAVYENTAELAEYPLPPSIWTSKTENKTIKFDPVRAKKLLTDAGIEDGFKLEIWAMSVQRPYNPNARKMAELIQEYLRKINVEVKIVSFELGTFLQNIKNGKHQTALMGWAGDNGGPDNFLTPLLSCNGTLTGENSSFWCNPKFDQLLKLARLSNDEKVKAQLYNSALEIFKQNLPWLPIAYANQSVLYNKRVSGFVLRPTGGIDFSNVTLTTKSKTDSQYND